MLLRERKKVFGKIFGISVLTFVFMLPLIVVGADDIDVKENISELEKEKQKLLSEIETMEQRADSARVRIGEINQIIENLLRARPTLGSSTYDGGGISFTGLKLNIFAKPSPLSRIGRIQREDEFVLFEGVEGSWWWSVRCGGTRGYVLINPSTISQELPVGMINVLESLREIQRTLGSDKEEIARVRAQEAIVLRERIIQDAIEARKRAEKEAVEEREKAARVAEERSRREAAIFEARKSFGSGKWKFSKSISPIDDSATVILRLVSERQVATKWGSVSPEMVVRCKEGETDLFVRWGFFVDSDESRVTTRLDKEQATNSFWGVSSDFNAIFCQDPKGLIKQLWSHDSLFIRLTPYGESPVETTFDLRGLAARVGPLREACNW